MKHDDLITIQTEMTAAIYRVVLPAAAVILAAIVLAIPAYYETTTLWYKTGIDKTMLQTGQYFGLTALILIYLQVLMAVRGSVLGRIFGEINLIRCHRINGAIIAITAVCHVLLVLVPEGLSNLPVGWKFWPEMAGAALLLLVLLVAATAYFRQLFHLPFRVWRILHKPAGYLVLLLVTIHSLFVSESFERPAPRILIVSLFLLVLIISAAAKYRSNTGNNTSPPY